MFVSIYIQSSDKKCSAGDNCPREVLLSVDDEQRISHMIQPTNIN